MLLRAMVLATMLLSVTSSDYSITDNAHGNITIVTMQNVVTPVTVNSKEKACLAENIYFEARGESYEGKLAVATVTLNRMSDSSFPETLCGVVWQRKNGRCQFSWTCDGKSDRITNVQQYEKAIEVVNEVLYNDKRSPALNERVKFFHSKKIKPPVWTRKMKHVAEIGQHHFYG